MVGTYLAIWVFVNPVTVRRFRSGRNVEVRVLDAGSSLVQTYIFHNGRLNNSVGTIGYHNRARDDHDRGTRRLEIGPSSLIFRESKC